jgi:hypothetical protein
MIHSRMWTLGAIRPVGDDMNGVATSYSYGGVEKATRNNIMELQGMLEKLPDNMSPKAATEKFVTHYFAPQTYARRMTIAKDMCVVGKIHKHAHLNILLFGSCKVVTEFGEEILAAPHVWTSESGTKRAVFALEDLEWITVHDNPDNLTDIDALEETFIASDYETFDRLQLEMGETK